MRRPLFAMAIATLLVACVPALQAQDLLYGRFRDYLESFRSQAGIPGLAATIVGYNDILWEQAFGRQDLERAIPTQPNTPFHLSGLTEVFTASLILRCVEEGRLSLDDLVHGDDHHASNGPHLDRARYRAVLSGAQKRRARAARHARHRMADAGRRQRSAVAARSRLVRAVVQRFDGRLAVRC